jgi:hypothetical protein
MAGNYLTMNHSCYIDGRKMYKDNEVITPHIHLKIIP